MNLVSVLLYPIALLLPAASALESESAAIVEQDQVSPAETPEQRAWPEIATSMLAGQAPLSTVMLDHTRPMLAWQVHIEQRMQIRITPRLAVPERRSVFVGVPERDVRMEMSERKMGKCLAIGGIAGVQPDKGSRLLLYMRDRRLVAADLERSCRARDFYSGFYLARTQDGQLCVDRDSLLSRSGMSCKLTRIRQLVESER
jgi:hypothetical protein